MPGYTGLTRGTCLLCCAGLLPAAYTEAPLEPLLQEGLQAQETAREAQRLIERLDDESDAAEEEYRGIRGRLYNLRIYHEQLERQIERQRKRVAALRGQIGRVERTRSELAPLLREMLEALQRFIQLDLPFLPQERAMRVQALRELMDKPQVTLPEKYRRIMEAYLIEIDYGNRLQATNARIEIDGRELGVELLRAGRLALYYRTLDGEQCGRWDPDARRWRALPDKYAPAIAQGLRIARRQAPPDLVILPLPANAKAAR